VLVEELAANVACWRQKIARFSTGAVFDISAVRSTY